MHTYPKAVGPLDPKDVARFWANVRRGRPRECWEWTACRIPSGAGVLRVKLPGGPRQVYASRVAYLVCRGEDPGRRLVCRTCKNRSCCNPAHLFLGTHTDARRRGSKLTIGQVWGIRRAVGAGTPYGELARRYGVHPSTVRQIARGEIWKAAGTPRDAGPSRRGRKGRRR